MQPAEREARSSTVRSRVPSRWALTLRGEEPKLCQNPEQSKVHRHPKGVQRLSFPRWGVSFPYSLDTTVTRTKEVPRAVGSNEMRNFVIPTLPVFQNFVRWFSVGWNPGIWGAFCLRWKHFGLLAVLCSRPPLPPFPSIHAVLICSKPSLDAASWTR